MRIISVKINGHYLTKDNKSAGVQGEANVTSLRIEFDESWDSFAKRVTWWDAKGGNPVKVILEPHMLENAENGRIYIAPIPGEPLMEAGHCTFVIDGYADGKRQRSISDELFVKEAPIDDDAGEASDPTPTQAEQLQAEIEAIKGDIQSAIGAADRAEEASAGVREALDNLPEGSVLVVNNLTTGGASAALSAEMGKTLNEKAEAAQKAADDAAEAAKEHSGGINPNLLDNWYFADAINQRGLTEYTGGGYCIDRWKTDNCQVTSDGIYFPNQGNWAIQPLEGELKRFLDGKQVTLSLLYADGGIDNFTFTYEAAPAEQTTLHSLRVCGVLMVDGAIMLWCYTPSTIVAAKLEVGTAQTLAHQEDGVWVLNELPDKAQEWTKCLRYFYRLKPAGSLASTHLGTTPAAQTANVFLSLPLPVPMRISPAVTCSGSIIVSTSGSSAADRITATIAMASPDSINSRIAFAANAKSGSYVMSAVYNVFLLKGDYIDFDANL